ncbi:MAG: sialate O-acetylesterase [Verrucomicrobiales bacterium]|jgi:sialate O-acetylesterase|nr:sialate O-acetylesterase [Verrucomicrobiales bacterium]
MRFTPSLSLTLLLALAPLTVSAAVQLDPLFTDHAVLQRGAATPVFGTASPGETITLTLGAATARATADRDGNWTAVFNNLTAAESLTLTVNGSQTAAPLTVSDVDVGDVYVCSGQSNMAFRLADREEIAAADRPHLRFLQVPYTPAATPAAALAAGVRWQVITPQSAGECTAVGYYFAKFVQAAAGVPIGLLKSDWSGTDIKPWVPLAALTALPVPSDIKAQIEQRARDYANLAADAGQFPVALAAWQRANNRLDPGNTGFAAGWAAPEFDDRDWQKVAADGDWAKQLGLADGGVLWLRKKIHLPAPAANAVNYFEPGAVRDQADVYINGKPLAVTGTTPPYFWNDYARPGVPRGEFVKPDADNVYALRIICQNGKNPGLPPAARMGFRLPADAVSDEWRAKVEHKFAPLSAAARAAQPQPPSMRGEGTPGAIYNGMVAPLTRFAVKGVLWYQGESSAGYAENYHVLLQAMIDSWRAAWRQDAMPFYVVQLANFSKPPTDASGGDLRWPGVREGQNYVAQHDPNVKVAVTIDIGDANDIHPRNKRDVGYRLALQALAHAYGQPGEYSGPVFQSADIAGGKIRVQFTHADGGLVAKDGALRRFVIAGADQKWHEAEAVIDGDSVVVSSPNVSAPVAVRYAWAGNPEGCNLYNRTGLPASPFRTDDWPLGTKNRWF